MKHTDEQYRKYETLRKICKAIEARGPMSILELCDVVFLTYGPVRLHAKSGVEMGYLKEVKIPRGDVCGRPLLQFARTDLRVPAGELSSKARRARERRAEQKALAERLAHTEVVVRRDPFQEAFFGRAA